MDLKIQAVGFTADDKLKQHIEKKVTKLNHYYKKITTTDVYLKLDSHSKQVKDKVVEVKVSVPGKVLFASETEKRFENAVDKVSKDIVRQLKKWKQKRFN